MTGKDDNSGAKPIPEGKVPPSLLKKLLDLPRLNSNRVLIGPALGEDAAVVNFPAGQVVITTDPITFPTPKPGFYAVHVNANDVAVMGARPTFFILTMILPPGTRSGRIEEIMAQVLEAANALGVVLIGGHSEISAAVITPVLSVAMFGELLGDRPLSTGDGRPGDAVVQVNPMAVEGTSILAAEHRDELILALGLDLVERAARFNSDPGLSVVAPANLAAVELAVHAMHDPTEGGLATGLMEIAAASGTGIYVEERKLIVAEETIRICERLGYDPLGLIGSGCLVFTVSADLAGRALEVMSGAGYKASVIGRLTGQPGDYRIFMKNGEERDLPVFEADELTKK